MIGNNLDHLASDLGIRLELGGTEVAVAAYSADILAANRDDGSRVLIENQYGWTGRHHLGADPDSSGRSGGPDRHLEGPGLQQQPLSQKHRSTFLPLQHAATRIFSVDWGLGKTGERMG